MYLFVTPVILHVFCIILYSDDDAIKAPLFDDHGVL